MLFLDPNTTPPPRPPLPLPSLPTPPSTTYHLASVLILVAPILLIAHMLLPPPPHPVLCIPRAQPKKRGVGASQMESLKTHPPSTHALFFAALFQLHQSIQKQYIPSSWGLLVQRHDIPICFCPPLFYIDYSTPPRPLPILA